MVIFISYNRQTKAIAKALVEDVETLGHTVWFDQWLSGGQARWDQILSMIRRRHAIGSCSSTVLLYYSG